MADLDDVSIADMRAVIQRRECAAEGHPPSTLINDGIGQALIAMCRCGVQRWIKEPTRRVAEPTKADA